MSVRLASRWLRNLLREALPPSEPLAAQLVPSILPLVPRPQQLHALMPRALLPVLEDICLLLEVLLQEGVEEDPLAVIDSHDLIQRRGVLLPLAVHLQTLQEGQRRTTLEVARQVILPHQPLP